MNFEEFKQFIHESWWEKLAPWIDSDECDRIYAFLKKESLRGIKLAPLSSNVWRCFLETPYDDLKLVICGLSPYHTLRNNKPIADGLLMGCSITKSLQPSLGLFYKAIEADYDVIIEKDPDVSYLAHQGILMFNTSLTTPINKAGAHCKLWEPFVKYLFTNVLDVTGVLIVFLGKEAAKAKKYVAPFTWTFEMEHPAAASYRGEDWNSENLFKNVNKVLNDNNGFEIQWYKT